MFLLLHLLSDQLHTLTALSMQFHTKLNRFQQLACLLVTISEIHSKMVHLEMGFKDEKLQNTLQKFVEFITGKCGIMVAINTFSPAPF
jgi:hypothetical protein